MKLLGTIKRLVKLGFFVGAGAALLVVDACGGATRPRTDADAVPDADADSDEARDADVRPQDASDDDRWDVPLE
jgi:hypothetical protein